MIDPHLYTEPQALDRVQHRLLCANLQTVRFDRSASMNSMFVAAAEFSDVCREFPIVFIEAGSGDQGQREVAPVAVLGLSAGENLFWQEGGAWAARYVPALLRSYPFGIARVDENNFVVVFDAKHGGLSHDVGERLFDDNGEPTPAFDVRRQLAEDFEREAQRTRLACQRLLELELLRPMRFDAKLPDGGTVAVEGFLTVHEERLAALSDEQVVELARGGLLGLIHAHQISLPLMRTLVERRFEREQRKAGA